jgi:rfaE bifunctional protein kinase chain/domain
MQAQKMKAVSKAAKSRPGKAGTADSPAPPRAPLLKRARVLVVGDVMLDRYWFGEVSRISPEAPVPVVKIGNVEDRPGGAANVALNIAALGAGASLLSVVGRDEPGRKLQSLLKRERVTASLQVDSGISTTIKLRVIGRHQQLLRIDFETWPSHEVLLDKLNAYSRMLPRCDVVIMSDYGKGGLTHIGRMIERARAAGKTVLVDPKGDDYARYRGADILTPNLNELREVVGTWKDETDLARRAQKLRRGLNLKALLVTRAEDGMSLFRENGAQHIPASQVREVSDVTGAGDTVIATLAVMLAAGIELPQAVKIANVAAGIVVGKLGAVAVPLAELMHELERDKDA